MAAVYLYLCLVVSLIAVHGVNAVLSIIWRQRGIVSWKIRRAVVRQKGTVSRRHCSAQVEFLLGSCSGYTIRDKQNWDRNLSKFESLVLSFTIISEGKIKTSFLNTIGYFNLDTIQSCLLARSLYVHQDANESIKLFSKQQYIKQFIFPDGTSISYWELGHYHVWCFVGQA